MNPQEFTPMSTVHALQPTLSFISETTLPTRRGTFVIRAYRDPTDGSEPIALLRGDLLGQENVPVRVHDACLTSEVFGSLKCDCRDQLEFALDHLAQTDLGVVIYLPQEGRGIGLANKIAAYRLQEAGHDTVDANRLLGLPDDARRYDGAAAILKDLGVRSVALLTNNPRKVTHLQAHGVEVVERIPVLIDGNPHSTDYLETKRARMGHWLS